MKTGDDPGDYTVAEVQEFLADASDFEADRIREAERAGKGRVGILTAAVTSSDGYTRVDVSERANNP